MAVAVVAAAWLTATCARAAPAGTPLVPRSLAFSQDGLHNCGTVAMLLSWAACRPAEAGRLVRKLPNGGFVVCFPGRAPVSVSAADLARARRERVVNAPGGDPWPLVVLAAFARARSGTLDFAATEWIYAGEIGECLTGGACETFEIKPETQDAHGRIQVGRAIPAEALHERLRGRRGRPAAAYTNRRVHIWAILDYDAAKRRVRIRNPRRAGSEWVSLETFRARFQLVVAAPAPTRRLAR